MLATINEHLNKISNQRAPYHAKKVKHYAQELINCLDDECCDIGREAILPILGLSERASYAKSRACVDACVSIMRGLLIDEAEGVR